MAKAIQNSKRSAREVTHQPVEPLFHFFAFVASLEAEMRAKALAEAAAAEPDIDDWSELEALHCAQRRARRAGKRR